MARYVVFFTYNSGSWDQLIKNPEFDRSAAMRQIADSMGGTLESIDWMFGPYDGLEVLNVPDSVTAAALSVTLTSSGAFKHVETHELLDEQQMTQAIQTCNRSRQAFRPPGEPG
jgi:uncharacterized protein with GYD domain